MDSKSKLRELELQSEYERGRKDALEGKDGNGIFDILSDLCDDVIMGLVADQEEKDNAAENKSAYELGRRSAS